jgi:subtilisin family serine protease
MNMSIKRFLSKINLLCRKDKTYGFNSFYVRRIENNLPKDYVDWSIVNGNFNKIKYQGRRQIVGVLDSGVDHYHSDLVGQVESISFLKRHPSGMDQAAHGTFVIGQIVGKEDSRGIIGIAPKAKCLSGRVLYGDYRDNNIYEFEKSLVDGINYCVEYGCGAINMSLGFSYKSKLIEETINNAVKQGVIVIAAAGNEGMEGSHYKSYPASYENCISVASANKANLVSWFSTAGIGDNRLEQPEIAVASLEYFWGCMPNNKYGMAIGTSMAAPVVAGIALLWREAMIDKGTLPENDQIVPEFRKWLRKHAKNTNNIEWDSELGYGVLIFNDQELAEINN